MKTNLKTIIKFRPCSKGITELMNNLGHICVEDNWEDVYNSLSKEQQTKDIDFKFILESNGIEDTYGVLRTQSKKTRTLIGADIVESVLYIYEKQYPNDMRMRDWIQGIRDHCNGKITKAELNALKIDVAYAVANAANAVVYAANAVVYAATDAAYAAVNAVATGVVNTAATAVVDANTYAAAADILGVMEEQWKKNKEILLKYI